MGGHEGDTFNFVLVHQVASIPTEGQEIRVLNGVAKCAVYLQTSAICRLLLVRHSHYSF